MTSPSNPSLPPPGTPRPPPSEYPLCTCFQIQEAEIERTVRVLGLRCIEEITRYTQAGGGCHTCWPDLEAILDRCARGRYKYPLSAEDRQRILVRSSNRRHP